MSEFSIRLARVEDAEHLPAIEMAAGKLFESVEGLAGIAGLPTISADEQRRMIRKGHCLVATAGERIVGFLSTEPHGRELSIREFSIHSNAQRRGLGSVLLRACAIDARNSGFRAITLTTFIDVSWNAPFYARHEFAIVEDLDAHPRLKAELDREAERGLPHERRCAMIKFL